MTKPTLSIAGDVTQEARSDGHVTVTIPIAIRRRSGRRVVTLPSGEAHRPSTGARTALQTALVRGHRWLRLLESGERPSMSALAQQEKTDISYVARMINLTLLAPEIVDAILSDTLPEGARLNGIAVSPPVMWEAQRTTLLGSPATGERRQRPTNFWMARAAIRSP